MLPASAPAPPRPMLDWRSIWVARLHKDTLQEPRPFRLLDLPHELRDLIYAYVFSGVYVPLGFISIKAQNTGLLFACHQTYAEATYAYYNFSSFNMKRLWECTSWMAKLGIEQRQRVPEVKSRLHADPALRGMRQRHALLIDCITNLRSEGVQVNLALLKMVVKRTRRPLCQKFLDRYHIAPSTRWGRPRSSEGNLSIQWRRCAKEMGSVDCHQDCCEQVSVRFCNCWVCAGRNMDEAGDEEEMLWNTQVTKRAWCTSSYVVIAFHMMDSARLQDYYMSSELFEHPRSSPRSSSPFRSAHLIWQDVTTDNPAIEVTGVIHQVANKSEYS